MKAWEWKPSEFWPEGGRWELDEDGVMLGRVVRFTDGDIAASVAEPSWKTVKGRFESLGAAGRAVEAALALQGYRRRVKT